MSRNAFSGWQRVFVFTCRQTWKGKGFKNVTIGLSLLFLLGGFLISPLMAYFQGKAATESSPLTKVRIVDHSGLEVLYLEGFTEQFGDKYPLLSFTEEAEASVLTVEITQSQEGYLLKAVLPYESEFSGGDIEDFLKDFESCMELSKLFSSDIPEDTLQLAVSGVHTEFLMAGEAEKSLQEELTITLLPMLIIFVLYMMILIYGQGIGNLVSVEKSSKLMEMVLTMTRPSALLWGKITASVLLALLQFFWWLSCGVFAFCGGTVLAEKLIYPEYTNYILEVLAFLRGREGSSAFSAGAVLLCFISICLGFLFYCVLAGAVSSFVSKTEELAQCMAYYQMLVVVGFFCAYLLPMQEKEWLNTILRIIPFSGAYLLPGDILTGNVTPGAGLVYVLILLAFTIALVLFAGRIYREQVFYRGSSLAEKLKRKR